MHDWTTIATFALGSVVILYVGRWALGNRFACPLPPGPSGLPLVGNVFGIDASAPWITYAEWARRYGDIIYYRQLGKDIVIINSEKIAKDLLDTRSGNYSDRPFLITTEMCGLGYSSVLLPYGDRWRLHRRIFHQTFRPDAVTRFLPLQHRRACHLLRQLLSNPRQLDDHVFEYTASVILNSAYDYDPASRKDELVKMAEDVLKIVVPAFRPDVATALSAFPLLLYVPSWFPGMSFKSQMAIARMLSKQFLERPFEYALQKAKCSSAAPSMVSDALRGMEEKERIPNKPFMEALKEASGTAFLAASETSHSVLMIFFLMMVLNPSAQEKAQSQIDTAMCRTRLPTIDDRPLLPFIDAILWETLRCHPISPLSQVSVPWLATATDNLEIIVLPHAAVNDDVYGGFHIPKGAALIANVWSMAHDESKYPNPHTFIPERFLNDDGSLKPNNIEHLAFGFGRRVCVGKYFADTSVWSVIAKVLAVFKILKPLDENGLEIQVEAKFSSGVSRHPVPFGYSIVPRFPGINAEKLEQLIAASNA